MLWAYCRVSSNKQLEGLSMSLQGDDELLNKIANNFKTNVGRRVYADNGRSAYKGEHLKGELGRFLSDLDKGETSYTKEKISEGDILVIRHLDRLSRLNLSDSMTIYNNILKSGIRIHTTMDGRTYSNDDPNDVQAVNNAIVGFVFANANEESKKKAYYQHKNTMARIEQFLRGERYQLDNQEYPYELGLGQVPFHMVIKGPHKNKYVTPKQREIKVLKQVVEHYLEGNSLYSCSSLMKKMRCYKSSDQIKRILMSKSLIGVRELNVAGTQYELNDYYPRICTNETFDLLQERLTNQSLKYQYKPHQYNTILCGNSSLRCGLCKKSLVPARYRGNIANGYKVYKCRTVGCNGFSLGQSHLNRLAIKAIQDYFSGKVDGIRQEILEVDELIKSKEQQLISFEESNKSSAKFSAMANEVSNRMVELMSLRSNLDHKKKLLSLLELKTRGQWITLESKLNHEDNNDERLIYRDLFNQYISNITTFGKHIVIVSFYDNTSACYLIVRNRGNRNLYYARLTVVTEGQYEDLLSVDPSSYLKYVTKRMIKNQVFNETDIDVIKEMGLQKELRVLSINGSARTRQDYIECLTSAIKSSDYNFIEWSRDNIFVSGLTTQDVWHKYKIDDLREFSNLRFFKYAFFKISGKIKLVDVIATGDINIEELQSFYRAKGSVYLHEMFSEKDKVPFGTRTKHVLELQEKNKYSRTHNSKLSARLTGVCI